MEKINQSSRSNDTKRGGEIMKSLEDFIDHCVEVQDIIAPKKNEAQDSNSSLKDNDIQWRVDKIDTILKMFNEPLLNLHLFNPYLKS